MRITRDSDLRDTHTLTATVLLDLYYGGVLTVGDLLDEDDTQLERIENIGPAQLKEIRKAKKELIKML